MDKYIRFGVISAFSLLSTSVVLRLFAPYRPQIEDIDKSKTVRNHKKKDTELSDWIYLGDATILKPDFVDGLLKLCNAASKTKYGVGYIRDGNEQTVIITKSEHIIKLLFENECNMEICGLNKVCLAYFETSAASLLKDAYTPMLGKALREPHDEQFISRIANAVSKSAMELMQSLSICASESTYIDVYHHFSLYHLNCIGLGIFEHDLRALKGERKGETFKALNFILNEIPKRALSDQDPFLSLEQLTQRSALLILKHDMRQNQTRLSKDREEFTKEDIQSLTNALWDIKDSAIVMTIAMYYLVKHADWLAEIQREADSVFEQYAGKNKAFSISDFPKCEAVVKESLRMLPPDIVSSRKTCKQIKLEDGLMLPAKIVVWSPILYLHHDFRNFGMDADVWNPRRWLRQNVNSNQISYFTYDNNERIGKRFLLLESVLAISTLAKRYDFDLNPDFEFNPVFNQNGIKSLDPSENMFKLELKLRNRLSNPEFLYDWSLENGEKQ